MTLLERGQRLDLQQQQQQQQQQPPSEFSHQESAKKEVRNCETNETRSHI